MKVYDYKPKGFKGSLKINIPDYLQRLDIAVESGIKTGEKVNLNDNVGVLKKLLQHAKKNLIEINLEKGRESIKSWQELLDSGEDDLIQRLAAMMIKGSNMGEA
jgi:hypothetical protein